MKLFKEFRIWAILVSCSTIVLGGLMVIWPDISALVVCYVLAVLCILTGIYELMRYFKLGFIGIFFQFDLTLGICSLLVGALLLLHPDGAISFLPIAVGLYILIASVFDIQLSVEMKRYQMSSWWISFVFGIVSTLFAFFLFVDPFAKEALMMFIGISLILSSVQNLYLLYSISKVIKVNDDGDIIKVSF
ncbi:MAG: HdeD family acid-resistance protein [Longibaculum sp.]